MIEDFTGAYDKARQTVGSRKFAMDWHSFLTDQAFLKMIFSSSEGPAAAYGGGLDKFRKRLSESKSQSESVQILVAAGINPAGSQVLTDEEAQAVATLKMCRHFYLQKSEGAHSLWIFAQPYSFHKWVFDEIKGCTPGGARAKLDMVDEVYKASDRTNLGNGVTTSVAWCQKCVANLGSPNAATKQLIKDWFFHQNPDDGAMDGAAATLLDGFKKVGNLLRSTKLIFSDDPIDRMSGDAVAGQTNYRSNWKDYAFVLGGERLDVVYIQNGTLTKWGSADKAWMATLAIIHELTHRVLGTKDIVYDFSGLKPSAQLDFRHAIANADSWAYFAADMNGQVTNAARQNYYRQAATLREYLP